MRVVIIEDEQLTALRLQGMLQKYDPSITMLTILPSVAESVQWLRSYEAPDLIFMDIHLEDDLCFKIFDLVSLQVPVIFTTAYDEYMVKAFKVNSIDYLLKPINYEDLAAAINKFKALQAQQIKPDLNTILQYIGHREPQYKTRFMMTIGTKIKSIETSEIAYFYSDEKITFLVPREGQHIPIEFSLDKLNMVLDPKQFFRVNRQFIICFSAIKTVHNHFKGRLQLDLQPKFKEEVFISGDRMTNFKEWLGK
jgi:DNA-binding LytR/AlgR family response regulator